MCWKGACRRQAKRYADRELIRGATDSHVWAETFDRKLTDILAVESEIAGTIARTLQAKLTPGEQQAVAAKPTESRRPTKRICGASRFGTS